MAEGMKLVVSADFTQAEAGLNKFVKTAGKSGQEAGAALSGGLNKVDAASTKTFSKMSANAKAAIKPISVLGDSIETLRAKLLARREFLITATDIGKIKIYNTEIKALEAEMIRLQAIGTSSMGAVGKAGTKAFSFLRTAAQVLPGIGIAGIFGAAFAGIGSLFSNTSAKADELKQKLKELIVPLAEISDAAGAGTQEELSKVKALSNAVLNQTLSYKERNNALNQLKDINKSYFGDLTVETAALGLLRERVDEYTKAIINAAVIKAFGDEIGKIAIELSKQERALSAARKEFNKLQNDLSKGTETPSISPTGEVTGKGRNFAGLQRDIQAATEKYDAQGKVVGQLRGQMLNLRESIDEAVRASLNFRPLEVKDPKKVPKVKVEAEFIPKFDLKNLSDLLTKGFKTEEIFLDIQGIRFAPEKVKTDIQKLKEQLETGIGKISPTIDTSKLNPQFAIIKAQYKSFAENINASINSITIDNLANVGEALGAALTGGDLGSVFKNFGNIVGEGLKTIGKQLITFGVLAKATQKSLVQLFTNPGLAIGVGVALVAAGAALKASLSKGVKGFKEGGFTGFGNANEIAGVVHKGEFVVPADVVRKIGSGNIQKNLATASGIGATDGVVRVMVRSQIRGNHLLLSNERTGKSNRR